MDQYDLSSLRLLLSGVSIPYVFCHSEPCRRMSDMLPKPQAAPMGSSLEDKLMERLRGTKITQAYGLTVRPQSFSVGRKWLSFSTR